MSAASSTGSEASARLSAGADTLLAVVGLEALRCRRAPPYPRLPYLFILHSGLSLPAPDWTSFPGASPGPRSTPSLWRGRPEVLEVSALHP